MQILKRLLGATVVAALAAGGSAASVRAASVPNTPHAVEHALNRLAYGPRPGDVDRVRAIGLGTWIEQQLHPDKIDDSALTARLPPQPVRPERFDDPKEGRRWGRESVQALSAAKMTRAVYSDRQLEEVLVDFWFNHFNVFAGKGRTSMWVEEYERTAIRPHVLGKFRDLLEATAKSPAMLFYLDNWLSADPDAADQAQRAQQQRAARRGVFRPGAFGPPQRPPAAGANPPGAGAQQPPKQAQQRRRGLNENYGRELLELHTLGVDGGYTQKDIIEVARAFTGWTIAPARPGQGGRQAVKKGAVQEGDFRFTPALHDRGEKIVLGHRIKAGGGMNDGEQVLDIVASHPATAHHIAYQLAQRFVSDDPPAALVERAARTFRDTGGDLREVVRTIITSDEFFATDARDAKVKTPLEFVASAARATGRDLPNAQPLLRALTQMGMPLYGCQPPTGYDDTADTWVSAGALVARMNIAQQLVPRDKDTAAFIGGPEFQRR
jgi:uncharacterized protein (DUF1800 family)